jgi:hypothetical protein
LLIAFFPVSWPPAQAECVDSSLNPSVYLNLLRVLDWDCISLKNILEAHSGRMWADNSTDGKGVTFSFSLPISN